MPLEFTYEIEGDVVDVPTPPSGLAGTATARLLAFVRNTRFSALVSVFGARTQALVDPAFDGFRIVRHDVSRIPSGTPAAPGQAAFRQKRD